VCAQQYAQQPRAASKVHGCAARCFCCPQLQDIKKNEDPRLSFSTPEFKEAQRTFTDNFKVV
jgi:hypothetical protein